MCIIWPDLDPTERELELSHAEWDPVQKAGLESEKTPGRGSVCGGPQTEAEAKVTSSRPEEAFSAGGRIQ